MQSQQEFETWSRLYRTFDTSPERYRVEQWKYRLPGAPEHYGHMDIWPILKTQIMLRACNYFHTGATRVVIPQEQRTHASSQFLPAASETKSSKFQSDQSVMDRIAAFAKSQLLGNNKKAGVGEIARSWPDFGCDVVCLGARINNYAIGPYKFQPHLDPLRLALDDVGYKSATFLLDAPNNDENIQTNAFLGGTYGFQDCFSQARQSHKSDSLIDFSEFPGFAEWYDEIMQTYPIDTLITRKIVSSVIEQTWSTYALFKDYLLLHDIKAVFIYAFYGIAGHAAAMACRELKIPMFDIQHGVAGQGHESYHWPGMPEGGYNTLPTHFLFWSQRECQAIEEFSDHRGPKAIEIGHSWKLVENILRGSDDYLLANADRLQKSREAYGHQLRTSAAEFAGNKDHKNILVTLFSNEDISWMEPLFEKSPDNWTFHIRLHPGELLDGKALEKRKAELDQDNVRLDLANELPMPVLLKRMDVHITKYSSSVLDAAAYGVPSLCYSLSAQWFYNPDEYSFVTIASQAADDLLEKLETIFTGKKMQRVQSIPAMEQADLCKFLKKQIG